MIKRLDERVSVAGQILPHDVAALAADGVTMIVNNRPDGEEADQPEAIEIEAAAREAGIAYRHVPVGASGLSANQVQSMAEALDATEGKVVAFCRSGTRSTYLWALARARAGEDAGQIIRQAAAAGYDLSPIAPYLEA